MNDRIANIRNFATERDNKIAQEYERKQQHLIDLLDKVKTLAPRMHELLEVGNALYQNRIPLGESGGYLEFSTRNVSNGWSHHVGFIADLRGSDIVRPLGFGIVGGGACGNDLFFNEDGIPSQLCGSSHGKLPGVNAGWDDSDLWHLELFLKGFDEFEKNFYAYVDGLK